MQPPAIQYAKSDDVHIAYMVAGEGPPDVVFIPGATGHVEGFWAYHWLRELAQHARVIWYDKRGTGASDRVASFSFEERVDDVLAVLEAVGIREAHIWGGSEGVPLAILLAASYPERVLSLTLYGGFPAWMRRRDYPHGLNMSLHDYSAWVDRMVRAYAGDPEALEWMCTLFAPSLAPDREFRAMWARGIARNSSPAAAREVWEMLYEVDVRHALPLVRVPTTVVHFTGDRVCPIEGGRYIAEHVPGAKMIELPGEDHFFPGPFPEMVEAVLDNLQRASQRVADTASERRFATVMLTDFVDSTLAAARAGDRAWSATLDRHDALAAQIVAAEGGQLVKTTGDGVLATFDVPSRGIRCASEMHVALTDLGLTIRAGLHAGEVVRRKDDIAGLAVHIASRISDKAGPGETLVSSTVKDLVVGSGFAFDDCGEHNLKGIEQAWHLFRFRQS
jgi:class 3 adenylate cyclase/pimeloyl-ACP methyl ester carboxylesterase